MKIKLLSVLTAMCMAVTFIPARAHAQPADPEYHVTITRGKDGSTEYTADITLENIAATYGTFGLKYDSDLFKFESVEPKNGLELKFTPAGMYGGEWKTDDGYYLFVWQASGTDSSEFDTTAGAKDVATMKFTLKGDADSIRYDSFSVMPWQETPPAQAFAGTLPNDLDPQKLYSEYWRYTDEKNEADPLERGRLKKSKARLLGLDTGGFYQAAVNGDLDEETGSYFYDVKTVIEYDETIDIKQSILRFHVIDKDTGEDIEGASVTLYDSGGEKPTDEQGIADYKTDAHASETFTYTVAKQGYCPVPASGADRPTVTTTEGTSTEITVELEKGYPLKGYVDLGQGCNISGDVQTGADVTFTRGDGAEITVQTSADRSDAEFETQALPKGTWTVTVTKTGYVKYVITDFEFNPTDENGETVFANGKKITPYIGSTRTGTSVSFIDAAAVKAEMLRGECVIGDVDDDGYVDATDMTYVMFNYGKRTVTENYYEFLSKGAPNSPQNP